MNLLKQNKNFRLLISARMITNVGDSIYFIAAMWLVYEMSGSSFYSGLAGFLTMMPRAVQFIIGPILDRYSIKRLIIITQIAQAVLLISIPAAALFNVLSVSLVLVVMPIVSFFNQFSFPAESALIPQILDKDQRVQANGLMTLAYQGTEAAFQAIGGVLVTAVGALFLFSADIVSFFIAVIMFSMLQLTHVNPSHTSLSMKAQCTRYFSDLNEGFHIVIHSLIGKMMVGSLMTNFALGALVAILPAYSDQLGGSGMYGLMMAGMAIGTLLGALAARQFERKPIGKMLMIGYFIGFLFWIAAASAPFSILTIILFSASMIFPGCNNVLNFTLIQNVVPRNMLARAMSLVASLATCIMPLGSLVGGALSAAYGPKVIFIAASYGFLFYAGYVALMPILRQLPAAGEVNPESYGFQSEADTVREHV
ncbi:MAG: MFS transporter [Sporolactobacillus sp.]